MSHYSLGDQAYSIEREQIEKINLLSCYWEAFYEGVDPGGMTPVVNWILDQCIDDYLAAMEENCDKSLSLSPNRNWKVVSILLTPDNRTKVSAIAKHYNLNLSCTIREILRNELPIYIQGMYDHAKATRQREG